MKLGYPPGATPIDPDEVADLVPSHLTLQSELRSLYIAALQCADRGDYRPLLRFLECEEVPTAPETG